MAGSSKAPWQTESEGRLGRHIGDFYLSPPAFGVQSLFPITKRPAGLTAHLFTDSVLCRDAKGAIHLPASVLSVSRGRTRHGQFKLLESIVDLRITAGKSVIEADRQVGPVPSVALLGHV